MSILFISSLDVLRLHEKREQKIKAESQSQGKKATGHFPGTKPVHTSCRRTGKALCARYARIHRRLQRA